MPQCDDAVFDAALAKIATCTAVHACPSIPANHAGIAALTKGTYTLTAGSGGGDWLIANGDTSGRKLTLSAQSGNNGTATGVCAYLAFTDGTTMLYVCDGDGDTINSGSPWTIAAVDVAEFLDPVNE